MLKTIDEVITELEKIKLSPFKEIKILKTN